VAEGKLLEGKQVEAVEGKDAGVVEVEGMPLCNQLRGLR